MDLEEVQREKNEYGYIAPFYNSLFYIFINPIRKNVLNTLSAYTDKKIIDLCCGTGAQLIMLEKNGFTDLHGVDLSEAMLSIARKSDSIINFYNKDVTETGFASETFDVALISFALHEKSISTQESIIEEIHRILKNDGILIVVDFEIDKRTNMLSKAAIDFIEIVAGGKEHSANYRGFLENNGLKGIIHDDHFLLQRSEKKMLGGITVNQYKKI